MADRYLFEPPTAAAQIPLPDKIYRFFKEPEHAIALAAGKVWISTLEWCRGCEKKGQGDKGEATHHFVVKGDWYGNSRDPLFARTLSRHGIYADELSSGTLTNMHKIEKLPDAYVFCTSEINDLAVLGPTFGVHGVEITNPMEFLRRVDLALRKAVRADDGTIGRVLYRSRTVHGASDPPGLIGYVKDPTAEFIPQREIRLLWKVNPLPPITSFLLDVPECAELCSVLPFP